MISKINCSIQFYAYVYSALHYIFQQKIISAGIIQLKARCYRMLNLWPCFYFWIGHQCLPLLCGVCIPYVQWFSTQTDLLNRVVKGSLSHEFPSFYWLSSTSCMFNADLLSFQPHQYFHANWSFELANSITLSLSPAILYKTFYSSSPLYSPNS